MNKKIFKTILTSVTLVMIVSLFCATGVLYFYFDNLQNRSMKEELSLAQIALENEGKTYFDSLSADENYRLTWIDSSGNVICDSVEKDLDNHSDRQEFKDAINKGEGFSSRYSQTLTEKSIYYAKKLSDGTVLRIAKRQKTVTNLLFGLAEPALILFGLSVILAYVLAKKSAKQIVEPLNNLNLDNPLSNDTYEELSPLLLRINSQHQQIDQQLNLLEKKNSQFNQITDNLQESLILLDSNNQIININKAACKLFDTDRNCLNKDFIYISRDYNLNSALQKAMEKGHCEIEKEIEGSFYQFDISRIDYEKEVCGAVILAFDITQRKQAEQIRKEFSANVSHELKTPLQGIIGSAELIENGMVKQQDVGRFVGHIRQEAQRMVNMINDIIRLSQLDEQNGSFPTEKVDLTALAGQCIEQLKGIAQKKNVEIVLQAKQVAVTGVRQLLWEILYNLLDNAIKYNKENGKVTVVINQEQDEIIIEVDDTGIGIAKEDQERIFERFYRVDKSHSKATGGTGLGLSIVKHAVMYHGGRIDIVSELNKGTKIKVIIPANGTQEGK
ncbi:MAG: ATP-binding protein [Erysipelotrichia bacterium]|nr:ATP-binding protein [Erysipelotrichia bacterium]